MEGKGSTSPDGDMAERGLSRCGSLEPFSVSNQPAALPTNIPMSQPSVHQGQRSVESVVAVSYWSFAEKTIMMQSLCTNSRQFLCDRTHVENHLMGSFRISVV